VACLASSDTHATFAHPGAWKKADVWNCIQPGRAYREGKFWLHLLYMADDHGLFSEVLTAFFEDGVIRSLGRGRESMSLMGK